MIPNLAIAQFHVKIKDILKIEFVHNVELTNFLASSVSCENQRYFKNLIGTQC